MPSPTMAIRPFSCLNLLIFSTSRMIVWRFTFAPLPAIFSWKVARIYSADSTPSSFFTSSWSLSAQFGQSTPRPFICHTSFSIRSSMISVLSLLSVEFGFPRPSPGPPPSENGQCGIRKKGIAEASRLPRREEFQG